VLFMKNAGLLTCGDALLSLAGDCGVGLFLVVGWAGTCSDRLPHHTITGALTVPFLDALHIPWCIASKATLDPAGFTTWYNATRSARSHRVLLVTPTVVAA
jgi:sulfopyruvate decarboxylase TPP-binding subunit